MEDYASRQRKPGKHLVNIGLVVVLHILIFWAINSGLTRAFVKKIRVPVEAVLLEAQKPDIPPPLPPKNLPPKNLSPKHLPPPSAYVPPVDVPVTAPAAAHTIGAASNTPTPPAPPMPKAEPVRTSAVANSTNCEKPEYPRASERLGEEGTVFLRFLVGVDGKVVQAEVEKSSGYKRLDEAARAGLSRCQFKPATLDGKPEQGWASMKYIWRIE